MARDMEAWSLTTIAMRLVRHAVSCIDSGSNARPAREDYPALTDDQWGRVVSLAKAAGASFDCTEEEFLGAYEYLTGEQP